MSYHHICTDADCPLIGQRTDPRSCRCHKTPEDMMLAEIETLRERRDDLLRANNAFEERARQAERAIKALTTLRPASEYHDDMGPVLWWRLPITEAPYVGSPLDVGITVEVTLRSADDPGSQILTRNVGGWPGHYEYTHFSPLPQVAP